MLRTEYCTVKEAASIIGCSRSKIYDLIDRKILLAEKIDGKYRISKRAVISLKKNKAGNSSSFAVMSRRLFVKSSMAFVGTIATQSFYDWARYLWGSGEKNRQAVELFREMFGYYGMSGQAFHYSLGRPKFGRSNHAYHPDHWAAGSRLAGPMGLTAIKNVHT